MTFFTRGNYLRMLGYGYVIGTAVVVLTSIGRSVKVLEQVVFIFVIGLCINSAIWGLAYLTRGFTDRIPAERQLPIYLALCVSGGVLGYLIGLTISMLLVYGRLPHGRGLTQALLITLAASLFAGFTMFYYLRLEGRLREKIRETELAQHELVLAREIQQRLLPPATLEGPGYRIAARNLAAQIVAGDFYDVFLRPDGTLAIFVADVAGKGIASSLIMASVKAILPLITTSSVGETMMTLNERLVKELGKREFVAMLHALYDPATGRLEFSNGGLPDPYLVRERKATSLFIGGQRLPLGMRSGIRYDTSIVQLAPGDRVLFFTDGLPESLRHDGEQFGYEALANLAAWEGSTSPTAALDDLIAALDATTRSPREDDWTTVLLERR